MWLIYLAVFCVALITVSLLDLQQELFLKLIPCSEYQVESRPGAVITSQISCVKSLKYFWERKKNEHALYNVPSFHVAIKRNLFL